MVATVTVDHPIRPARPEDCRFQVTLQGSPALRRANGGVLDHALEVVLVRRDAPGLRYLTKDDPRALLAPDRPMPRDRPPLPPGCEAMDPGFFTDTLDLGLTDYGAAHDGAARYYVLASFADTWADPRPLWIDHPDGPLPSPLPPSLPPRDPSATDVVQALLTQPGVTLRYYPTGGVARVAGAFRVAAGGSAALSLVAQHLRPTGGVSASLLRPRGAAPRRRPGGHLCRAPVGAVSRRRRRPRTAPRVCGRRAGRPPRLRAARCPRVEPAWCCSSWAPVRPRAAPRCPTHPLPRPRGIRRPHAPSQRPQRPL
jgi:hypothetical protein